MKADERYVIILAGGSGTRFWPKSRSKVPKQFLSLGSKQTLLQDTMQRALRLTVLENIFIVGAAIHHDILRDQLPLVPKTNFLLEPVGRNTALAVSWALALIRTRNKEARVLVMPSDHWVNDENIFAEQLKSAFDLLDDRIWLFGIPAIEPNTGYGYMECGKEESVKIDRPVNEVFPIVSFTEKPNKEEAERLIQTGRYLWNSGMFLFKSSVLWTEMESLLPELAEACSSFVLSEDAPDESAFLSLPSVSFDVGIVEKTTRIAAMKAQFGWNDLGTYSTVYDVSPKDLSGNVVLGDVLSIESNNCWLETAGNNKKVLAAIGVKDLIVIATDDALLVVDRKSTQKVKDLVELLRLNGREDLV